jgi:Flp pilus assembly protein TadG
MEKEGNMTMGWKDFVQETNGSVMILSAILIVMLLGFCGLAIDVGHYVLVKNQLQKAADAGALAGARALFPDDLQAATWPVAPDCSNAVTAGTQAAHWNQTDRATTVVADIQTGHWDAVNRTFDAGCSDANATFTNAVKVTTHRVDTPLFLIQVVGAVPKTIQATSIAAKLPVGGLKGGKGFPIAIGYDYVKENHKNLRIPLNDDTSDMGCWWLPGQTAPSDFTTQLKAILDDPGTNMPGLEVKDNWIYMNNGVINAAEQIIDSQYAGKIVYLPVVQKVKYRQATQIVCFLKFQIDKTEKETGQTKDGGTDPGKHYLLGTSFCLSECSGYEADNSVGEDYSVLMLKPAQLVF